ncbi:MAG: iron-sulfur cluster assembly protein [Candidatus Humimicrobiaceae bacterium]
MDNKKITGEKVYEALSEVYDPEIPINIVDLGLIYNVSVDENNNVDVEMTMTVRGCPMHAMITQQAKKKIEELEGVGNVNVKLVWDPPWTPDRISKEAKKKLQKGG